MESKTEQMIRWIKGEKPGPLRIDLNPTNRCNLLCRSCWMRAYPHIDHSNQVPRQRLLDVVIEGFSLGVREWEITGGGEPLLEFETTTGLIRRIKAYEMWGSITTNGTRFTDDLVREMVELGWNKIVFSIDGPTAAINDYLRGVSGAFALKLKALKGFQRAKIQLGKTEPQIQFNTVLSKANFEVLDAVIDLAAEVGCQQVCFEPITVHSALGEELKLTDQDRARLPKFITKALERSEATGVWTNAANYLEERLVTESNAMSRVIAADAAQDKPNFLAFKPSHQAASRTSEPGATAEGCCPPSSTDRTSRNLTVASYLNLPCYEPFYHLVIKTDGKVGPCCIFDSPEAANIKEHLLHDVWFGPYLQHIRGSLLKQQLPDFCAICNAGQVAENRRIRRELRQVFSVGADS